MIEAQNQQAASSVLHEYELDGIVMSLAREGVTAAQCSHKAQVEGSIPSPATTRG